MERRPIQIKPGHAGRLIVLVPYSPKRVAKIKTIAGLRWHQGEKCWTVPSEDGALHHLLTLFSGEPVEVDASLRSDTGLNALAPSRGPKPPEPPNSINPLLDRVRLAMRARHYSYRTEKSYLGWIRRFILFHRHRGPGTMAEKDVACFVSASSGAALHSGVGHGRFRRKTGGTTRRRAKKVGIMFTR